MEDKKFVVIDAEGNEKEMEIVFTYLNEENQKNYVFYIDPSSDEEMYVSSYDDEGRLYPVETDEEWDHLEEVLDHYQQNEHHCCHHEHHGEGCNCHHEHHEGECNCHEHEECECHQKDSSTDDHCCCKDKK